MRPRLSDLLFEWATEIVLVIALAWAIFYTAHNIAEGAEVVIEGKRYYVVELVDAKDPTIVYRKTLIPNESYFDILNAEMRAKHPVRRGTRYLIIFGKLSETAKMLGIKAVFKF